MLEALAKVIDPELRLPITELGMVGEITETSVTIKLTITACPAADRIEREVKAVVGDREVIMTVMTPAEREELKTKLRAGRAPRVNPFDEQNPCKVYLIGSGRHLRLFDSRATGHPEQADQARRHDPAAGRPRRQSYFDWHVFGGVRAGRLAWPDAAPSRLTVSDRRALGRPRLSADRHAPGHR
jgi:metal-sulfur cluster biosynthetic enzyme